MATHSSTLAWEIPRTEEPGGLQSMGSQESDTTERLSMHTHIRTVSEGESEDATQNVPDGCKILLRREGKNSHWGRGRSGKDSQVLL